MVQEHGFIIFFFQIMLDEYFISKKKMAQTLDVSLRTLQYNFKRIKLKKGGCMALTNLLLYCYENEISVDQIYVPATVAVLANQIFLCCSSHSV